jgi:hypothetical protein
MKQAKSEEVFMRCSFGCVIFAMLLWLPAARADVVSGTYSSLAPGTTVDLTSQGTLDWAKFGTDDAYDTSFFTATKIGNPVIDPNVSVLGTAPSGTPTLVQFGLAGDTSDSLNFTWTNGNFGMGYPSSSLPSVNSVVSETIIPAVNQYPLGLGAEFTASAAADTRILDVYVQGFNSDMLITASLSGGATASTVVSPTVHPANDPNNFYAFGVYQIEYSGAGETLTVSVQTQPSSQSPPPWAGAPQADFPNAGIFAATVSEAPVATPEPASGGMLALGLLGIGLVRRRRHSTDG